jgi:hypothetical protein
MTDVSGRGGLGRRLRDFAAAFLAQPLPYRSDRGDDRVRQVFIQAFERIRCQPRREHAYHAKDVGGSLRYSTVGDRQQPMARFVTDQRDGGERQRFRCFL